MREAKKKEGGGEGTAEGRQLSLPKPSSNLKSLRLSLHPPRCARIWT